MATELAEKQAHLLIVDDDNRIRQLLASYLNQNGFRVSTAANAKHARQAMDFFSFDLLVLDIMMEGESGLDLTKSLTQITGHVPVLLLSALSSSDDRIAGLRAGGDDYLSKPFEPFELLLRIQNILRRSRVDVIEQHTHITFGPFSFDIERGELSHNAEQIKLTHREREIMKLFAMRPGETVPREELSPNGMTENLRSVDVLITRLRQKIEADPSAPIYLKTVRGIGYIFHAQSSG